MVQVCSLWSWFESSVIQKRSFTLLNIRIRLAEFESSVIQKRSFTCNCSYYASGKFESNELLPMYGITRSMSRAGTPTDNAAMEAINGWIKAELFLDLHVTGERPVREEIDEYITFFNEARPAYALNYLTPKQYRESHFALATV